MRGGLGCGPEPVWSPGNIHRGYRPPVGDKLSNGESVRREQKLGQDEFCQVESLRNWIFELGRSEWPFLEGLATLGPQATALSVESMVKRRSDIPLRSDNLIHGAFDGPSLRFTPLNLDFVAP